jgi:hypothetical protein
MSLFSFSTLNKDWQLRLHTVSDDIEPTWGSANNKHRAEKDYRDWIGKIPNLLIVNEADFPGLPGVQRSDILRNKYLYEDGGLWSDVDIIYYRPMSHLGCNLVEYQDVDCGLCYTNAWFPIAFMLSGPGSTFFKDVLDDQIRLLNAPQRARPRYQKYGTKVYSYAFKNSTYQHTKIAVHEIYQKQWRQHGDIFAGSVGLNVGIGVHWYGGSQSAAEYEPKINHENWRDYPIKKMIEVTF